MVLLDLREYQELTVKMDHRALKARKVHQERMEKMVHKVLKDPQVLMEKMDQQDLKAHQVQEGIEDILEDKV